MRTVLARVSVALLLAGAATACGSDGTGGGGDAGAGGARVVVTTNILGDVVRTIVGDGATVDVIMPPGSNPHDFAPSAKQAAAMRQADVLVVNGRRFEEGLIDTIEAAEADGTVVVTATDAVPGDGARATDPHVFTDPVLMQAVVEHLETTLADDVPGLDTAAFHQRVDDYRAALADLDAEVTDTLAAVPADRRVLVTNHQVLGFFADRYGFDVLGVVIPGGTTLAEPSAADLVDLADRIAAAGVPAIFAETSAPARLADALAKEGADVEVVELYTESLGEPGSEAGTYLDMVRTNAERIAAALGGSG
ncbi:MAG TPA: metal ABC transporter substrate-binding protein [Acidimicrobiales bacterium]|nr:metal ABC transporter substrate-binding protein [Acidimicrobiales bacterium]